MKNCYGEFTKEQIVEYKKTLHASVHWLLIYKEESYEFLDKYFESLIVRVGGLNRMFNYSQEIMRLVVVLDSAREEATKENCNFKTYRKLILDAHTLIDQLRESD